MNDDGKRLPAHSPEAEIGLLGAVLFHESCMAECLGRFRICAEMFFEPARAMVWTALEEMHAAGKGIDLTTVAQWLRDRHQLDAAGGDTALESYLTAAPTAAVMPHYAEIVRQKYRSRRVSAVLRSALQTLEFSPDVAPDDVIGATSNDLHEIAADVIDMERSNADVGHALLKRWEAAHERRMSGDDIPLPGLETPFGHLNNLLCGYQAGLHFIAAPPSAGKTSIEGQIAEYVAAGGNPVLRIYLDDTHEDAIARSLSRIAGVSLPKLQHGFANKRDLSKIREDIDVVAGLPLFVKEDVETVEQICTLARLYRAKHGIKMLTVDYAQIVGMEGDQRFMQERDKLAHVCTKLKYLWKELRIPILLLSQVQRENYKQDSDPRKASMADLFGGAVLEHTASSVMILKRLNEDDIAPQDIDGDGYSKKFAVAAHLVKNKHGPQGMVPLWFFPKYFKFEQTPMTGTGSNARHMDWQEQIDSERGRTGP